MWQQKRQNSSLHCFLDPSPSQGEHTNKVESGIFTHLLLSTLVHVGVYYHVHIQEPMMVTETGDIVLWTSL